MNLKQFFFILSDILGLVLHCIEEEEEMVAMQGQQNLKPSKKVILVHISSKLYTVLHELTSIFYLVCQIIRNNNNILYPLFDITEFKS